MEQKKNQVLMETRNLKKYFPVEKKIDGQQAEVKAVNDILGFLCDILFQIPNYGKLF